MIFFFRTATDFRGFFFGEGKRRGREKAGEGDKGREKKNPEFRNNPE